MVTDYVPPRADGRVVSSLGFKQHLLKALRPRLAFDPAMAADQFRPWTARVRAKLLELMRFPDVPEQPEPTRLWSQPRPGYTLEKWESYPEPGSVIPFLMLVPTGVDAAHPAPAVLCFPGSAQPKELLAGEPDPWEGYPQRPHRERNDMARQYAQAGLVAVALDNPGTGELVEQPDALGASCLGAGRVKLSQDLICMGRNYVGLSAFQKKHVLDWVRRLPFVDSSRIALSGHSLGTEPAMVLGVLEPDLAAVVSNDYLASQVAQEQHLAPSDDGARIRVTIPLWHCIPDFWVWLDLNDLLAAIAPTPLLLTEGGHWTCIDQLKRAYEIAGAADALEIHHYPAYAEPETRASDGAPMPYGLTLEEYLAVCNVDVPNHHFKGQVAVPWLVSQLTGRCRS